jgi:hypothetical protein
MSRAASQGPKELQILSLVEALVIFLFLACMLLPLTAYSQTEVETWFWDETATPPAWVYQGIGNPQSLARLWASYPEAGFCNKDWSIPVKIHASIAQWCNWTMSGTRWDWRVRKPGCYAGDCITATVKSNQHVLVDYHDFNDLHSESISVNPDIPIFYYSGPEGATPPPNGSNLWTRAARMNDPAEWDTLFDSQELHNGIQIKLWNMICVVNCNSACEYQDHASISLQLLCQKPWIDRSTGYFSTTYPPPSGPHP